MMVVELSKTHILNVELGEDATQIQFSELMHGMWKERISCRSMALLFLFSTLTDNDAVDDGPLLLADSYHQSHILSCHDYGPLF
jgi:hypothetical protein